jgi:hypothetical protein
MIATETARTAILVLLGLSVLWVILCVVRNDTATLVRALIVAALLGLVFYYLNQTKLETLSYRSVKNDLFPPKPLHVLFQKSETVVAGTPQTIYSFADPGPELVLEMGDGGKSLSVTDIDSLNRVLEYVGLPPVDHGTPELSAVTGSNLDSDKYRWNDYALGTLTVERGICRNIATTSTFNCIQAIIVVRR